MEESKDEYNSNNDDNIINEDQLNNDENNDSVNGLSSPRATSSPQLSNSPPRDDVDHHQSDSNLNNQQSQHQSQHQNHSSSASPKEASPSSSPPPSDAARRVKIYKLTTSDWVDFGTGFCTGIYDSERDEAMLVVANEENPEDILLNHFIVAADIYSRQQDTLIVWTEHDGTDCALSFQEADGCLEMWDFINQVQRHVSKADEYPIILDSPVHKRRYNQRIILPPEQPDLSNLEDVYICVRDCLSRSIQGRERLITWIINNNYIAKLIEVFTQAEDLEALAELHILSTVIQFILSANDSVIFEYVLSDEIFLGMCGILEYDPDYPTLKASYRVDLTTTSRYKEVVPITDLGLKSKIHQTYRLLYLKDVVLARTLDDSTFTLLNSFVYYNQIDIIKHIQNDITFLDKLFGIFRDPNTEVKQNKKQNQSQDIQRQLDNSLEQENQRPEYQHSQSFNKIEKNINPNQPPQSFATIGNPNKSQLSTLRQDAVLFLRDLCTMGKNIQIQTRQELYRALCNRGLLDVCKWAITQSVPILHNTGSEVLMVVIDNEPNAVRSYILNEAKSINEKSKEIYTLMQEMCFTLDSNRDLGYKNQISEAIRLLLEPPFSPHENTYTIAKPKLDPTSDEFLSYFYDVCVNVLFKPLLEMPDSSPDSVPVLDFHQSTLSLLLCDLLSFFVTNHSFRAHYFILQTPITSKIIQLLRVKEKYLRLAALRYLRACVLLNNEFIVRYLDRQNLFKPMLHIALREGKKDNLISASILDLFESIRKINNKVMINSLVGKHEDEVKTLMNYKLLSGTFTKIYLRYEQFNEPLPPPTEQSSFENNDSQIEFDSRERKLSEATAEDEYFNRSDEGEDEAHAYINDNPGGSNNDDDYNNTISKNHSHHTLSQTSSTSIPLVDYGDDDDDDDVDNQQQHQLNLGISEENKYEDNNDSDQLQQNIKISTRPLPQPPLQPLEVKLNEKRQREEEDDEMLELMRNKKRLSPNNNHKHHEKKLTFNISSSSNNNDNDNK